MLNIEWPHTHTHQNKIPKCQGKKKKQQWFALGWAESGMGFQGKQTKKQQEIQAAVWASRCEPVNLFTADGAGGLAVLSLLTFSKTRG